MDRFRLELHAIGVAISSGTTHKRHRSVSRDMRELAFQAMLCDAFQGLLPIEVRMVRDATERALLLLDGSPKEVEIASVQGRDSPEVTELSPEEARQVMSAVGLDASPAGWEQSLRRIGELGRVLLTARESLWDIEMSRMMLSGTNGLHLFDDPTLIVEDLIDGADPDAVARVINARWESPYFLDENGECDLGTMMASLLDDQKLTRAASSSALMSVIPPEEVDIVVAAAAQQRGSARLRSRSSPTSLRR